MEFPSELIPIAFTKRELAKLRKNNQLNSLEKLLLDILEALRFAPDTLPEANAAFSKLPELIELRLQDFVAEEFDSGSNGQIALGFAKGCLQSIENVIIALYYEYQNSDPDQVESLNDFVGWDGMPWLVEMFFRRPVLLRYMSVHLLKAIGGINFICEAVSTFKCSREGSASAISAIKRCDVALSDTHSGGLSVSRIEFADGSIYFFKPRALTGELLYSGALRFMDSNGFKPLPMDARLVSFERYGWVSEVKRQALDDPEELTAFFNGSGAQLALLYALNCVDVHFENVVATKNGLFPIDLEGALQPVLRFRLQGPPSPFMDSCFDDIQLSVCAMSYLPDWTSNENFGAISDVVVRHRTKLVLVADANRAFALTKESITECFEIHQPFRDNVLQSYSDYTDEFLIGFKTAYDWISDRRDEFFAAVHDAGQAHDPRIVLRPTALYQDIIDPLKHWRQTASFSKWRDHLISSLRGLPLPFSDVDALEIQKMELASLSMFDVPHLNQSDMPLGVIGCFSRDALRLKVERLGPADRDMQCCLIASAFEWPTSKGPRSVSYKARRARLSKPHEQETQNWSLDRHLEEFVRRTVAVLDSTKIHVAQGGLTWFGLFMDQARRVPALAPVGMDLYRGNAGVIFFLTYASEVVGRKATLELINGALMPLINDLASAHGWHEHCPDVGIVAGITGTLFTFAKLDTEFGWDLVSQHTPRFLGLISRKLKLADELDVFGGVAGAALACVSAFRSCGDRRYLELAEQACDRLVSLPVVGWHKLRSGLSHGLSGVSLALCRLDEEIDRGPYLASAVSACLQEDFSYFDEITLEWGSDLDHGGHGAKPSDFVSQWCNGGAGISLLRSEYSSLMTGPASRYVTRLTDLDRFRVKMQNDAIHLCCGSFGRMGCIMEASRNLNLSLPYQQAKTIFSNEIKLSHALNNLKWKSGSDSTHPSLYRGVTGIAALATFALLNKSAAPLLSFK
ncbi:MAG: hypothetical protein CFE33_20345 [Pseudorhodobacter sp. PARRP1]|nr:MAG: hypothetical protein CFE33_20345 [Pseudorhodobacter sp. PARRP1]